MGVFFGSTEITGIHFGEQEITEIFFGNTEIFSVWSSYDGTLPAQYSANGSVLADYRIYGSAGGLGDDSGTAYGYEVDMSVSDGTTSTTVPIYIGSDPLGEDEYISFKEQKVYRRTENLFNIDDLWDKGEESTSAEASIFLEIAVENGIYTAGTDVLDNSNPNIASVFIAESIATNPPSATNGVFINRPRTITTTTGKLYIGIRVRSIAGYQTFTKETFAPYYINVVSGYSVPTTAIPYLQPTDPPVPLPQLPTVDGTNIVDYAGQSTVPSRFYAKYRKEGF